MSLFDRTLLRRPPASRRGNSGEGGPHWRGRSGGKYVARSPHAWIALLTRSGACDDPRAGPEAPRSRCRSTAYAKTLIYPRAFGRACPSLVLFLGRPSPHLLSRLYLYLSSLSLPSLFS